MEELDDLFAPFARASKEESLLRREFYQQSKEFDKSGVQESFCWRSVHVARELAKELIDPSGQFNKKALFAAIEDLEAYPHSLGPNRHFDAERQEHMLRILKSLHNDPQFRYAFARIGRPTSHLGAERLIRETLLLSDKTILHDAHARQAVLAALLTWLRQNVGSCFATAPAILIQQTQPLQFLADMSALLGSGRLSRVIEGEEFAVPLSYSWGAGQLFYPITNTTVEQLARVPGIVVALTKAGVVEAKGKRIEEIEKWLAPFHKHLETPFTIVSAYQILRQVLLTFHKITESDVQKYLERESRQMIAAPPAGKMLAASRFLQNFEAAKSGFKAMSDNALLKAWEFTLASLSESKADFASWNLYSSLGLHPEEPDGIGAALHEVVQQQIVEINKEIEACQSKYDHLYAQAKYLEGRMQRASEREIGWVSADYHIRKQEINRVLSERDEAHDKGRRLSSFFNFVIRFCSEKFKEYFQEVYDAEMHGETASPYDDSPAGFRLLYKHGRSNTALWTHIHTEGEFIQALSSFFHAIEIELSQSEEAKGLQYEVGHMITAIIRAIKEPNFIDAATERLTKAYGDKKRKPWAYVSGGAMHTLVSCYYSSSSRPKEEKRWVENETELLAFLIDAIKGLPLSTQRLFQNDPEKGMLAFSPTHAYLVKPGYPFFHEAWDNDLYTYTWIRDTIVHRGQDFLDKHKLDQRGIAFFVEKLLAFLPVGYQPVVKKALAQLPSSLYPFDFRESVIKILSYEKWLHGRGLQMVQDELDSLLYKHLPLFSEYQVTERLEALFAEMEELDSELTYRLIEAARKLGVGRYHIFSSADLIDLAKGLLISLLQTTRTRVPYHQRIVCTLQRLGFRPPAPLIFGDTNWVKKRFAFVVSPGSRELELWCVDDCGSEGRPLSIWKPYLDGTRKENWGLYITPAQYGQY